MRRTGTTPEPANTAAATPRLAPSQSSTSSAPITSAAKNPAWCRTPRSNGRSAAARGSGLTCCTSVRSRPCRLLHAREPHRPALAVPPLGDELDVLRLGALRTLGALELDLRAFGERLVALSDDRAVVDEQVLAAVLGLDEAVTLSVVEPLHGSGCHRKHLLLQMKERAEEAQDAQPVLARVRGQCSCRGDVGILRNAQSEASASLSGQ